MGQRVGISSSDRLSWSRVLIGRRPRHTLLRLVVLVLASIGVFGYCLLPVRTQGISMLPTYEPGSLKFVNALAYTWSPPRRGDIVAIRLADRRVVYLKRIIGLPTEQVRIDAGIVYADGVAPERAVCETRGGLDRRARSAGGG